MHTVESFAALFSNFGNTTWQMAVMWVIGGVLIYLAIGKKMEPSLLLPMGFGAILVNLPMSGAITQGTVEGPITVLFQAGMIAEITEFDDPEENHVKKLFKFFARFGYVEAECDYTISGTRAHVMVKPIKGTADIAPVVHRIISDFYSRCMLPAAMYRMINIRPVKKSGE